MSDLLEQARELAHYFETSRWSVKPERDAAATLRALVARVEAAERDAERLNSGCIVLPTLDDMGDSISVVYSGLDLRAAIDEARKQGRARPTTPWFM